MRPHPTGDLQEDQPEEWKHVAEDQCASVLKRLEDTLDKARAQASLGVEKLKASLESLWDELGLPDTERVPQLDLVAWTLQDIDLAKVQVRFINRSFE